MFGFNLGGGDRGERVESVVYFIHFPDEAVRHGLRGEGLVGFLKGHF